MSTDDWCTPVWLTDLLGRFDIDPCGNRESHVQSIMRICLPLDGLSEEWRGSVFANPPYSDVTPWATRLVMHTGPWCALVKLDPTTKWWSLLMTACPHVAPFRKRIKFEGPLNMTANFPSVLVYKDWQPSAELAVHLWMPRAEELSKLPRTLRETSAAIVASGRRRKA